MDVGWFISQPEKEYFMNESKEVQSDTARQNITTKCRCWWSCYHKKDLFIEIDQYKATIASK